MNAAERTRLETLAGRLVDAEGAITSAQETLARVLDAEIVGDGTAAKLGDVIGIGCVVPGNVIEVSERDPLRKWTRSPGGCMFTFGPFSHSSVVLTDHTGPVVVTKVAASFVDAQSAATEPEAGEWVTVSSSDERIVPGSRVRLGGVEGESGADLGDAWLAAFEIYGDGSNLRGGMLWQIRNYPGATVELWVPAEVTLPLPTEPGVFWGRVRYNDETYVGWVLYSDVLGNDAYLTLRLVSGNRWHYASHVTRLPLPDSEREKLR